MTLIQYFVDNGATIALVLALLYVVITIVSLLSAPLAPGEDRFGLKRVSMRGSPAAYEGELDGVRVILEADKGWTVTLESACPSGAELFAYRPMMAFDRPMRALFGPLRRLATPAAYGKGWAFYGSPASSMIVSRLPGPSAAAPWNRIELRAENLKVTVRCDERMSLERLREQVAAFRGLIGAIQG